MAGIFAGPFPWSPLRMVAEPLGDVGLGRHHALIERAIPGELKIFFLAIGRIGDGADSQDDLDHSQCPLSKNGTRKCYAEFTRPHRILSRCNLCRDAYDCRVVGTSESTNMTLETVSLNRSHEGAQGVYRHASRETRTTMTFSVFVPPHQAGAKLPVVWYLSGLTCTHANVTEKGEFRRACAELGLVC